MFKLSGSNSLIIEPWALLERAWLNLFIALIFSSLSFGELMKKFILFFSESVQLPVLAIKNASLPKKGNPDILFIYFVGFWHSGSE